MNRRSFGPTSPKAPGKVFSRLVALVLTLCLMATFLTACDLQGLIGALKPEDPTPATDAPQPTAPTAEPTSDDSMYADNPYMIYESPMIPDSDQRYLTADDLEKLSLTELDLARYEIYARHGMIPADELLAGYFAQQDWFSPAVDEAAFDEAALNPHEAANTQLIRVYIKIVTGGYTPASDNPYIPYYDPSTELILPESSTRKLTARDLQGYSADELIIIRNQIIALHGYTFGDRELMEYFLQCSWYRPSTAPGNTDQVTTMSQLEYENMEFILDYEENPNQGVDLSSLDTSLTYYLDQGFYRIAVPAYWQEYAVIRYSDSDGVPDISFYEKPDHETCGGHLFTIVMMAASVPVEFPQYTELGVVTDGRNYFRLLVRYPSDVQFSEENMELYQKMSSELSRILDTMTSDYYYIDYDPSLETD